MTHAFFRQLRPRVFAHRGGAGLAPENTLAAFDQGLALGADGVELDVHLSRDGVVVVHHDRALDRTTDRQGPLAALTASELERVDAGYRFARLGDHPFRGQEIGVPTLATVLARYRDIYVIVEMKENTRELARATVDVIRRADAIDRVCVGSFGWRALSAVRELEPALASSASRVEVRLALYCSRLGWPRRRVPYGGYQVPEVSKGRRVVSPRFVAHAHDVGLPVQVWTVDDPVAATRLLGWGADALITDRPDVIVPLVRGHGQFGIENSGS